LYGSPERVRIDPFSISAISVSAASFTAVGSTARTVPRRTPWAASERHVRAAAAVGNVLRIFRPADLS
jgi:hypothetical protein